MNKEATLGGTVRDRRLALGYSLGQLATKVNKTAASIRSWERGDTIPTEDETAALSDALDLDAELLGSLRDASAAAAEAVVEEQAEPAATATADSEDAGEPEAEDEPAEEPPAEEAPEGPDVEAADESEDDQATPAASEEPPAEEAAAEEDVESGEEPEDDAVDDEPALVAAASAEEGSEPPQEAVEEHADIDSETSGGEALAETVAALAAAGFGDKATPSEEPPQTEAKDPDVAEPPAAPRNVAVATDPAMHEAMTEAVPVVPVGSVAVSSPVVAPDMSTVAAEPYAAPRSSNPVVQAWDNVVETYRRVFDPRRKWIYRVRWVLLLIAFYIMLRLLAWSGGELWDAIGEVLDGIAFTPSETPDVSN